MKILVVGRGGREHAIAWKAAQSPLVSKVYVAPGNDGMGRDFECVPLDEKDNSGLVRFALENHIDLVIIGPEAALVNGLANELTKNNIPVFGPTAEAAIIEGSKQFAKDLMLKYNVPTARYATFSDYNQAIAYVHQHGAPIVIKYDGLAAGKGVVVAQTVEEADNALKDMLLDAKFGEGKVVIEEFLAGEEFSLMALVNGEQVVPLTIAQDHKRAYDGDRGPNTGGMGAYSPVPFISQDIIDRAVKTIMEPVAKALVNEGLPFTGILYGGLILTNEGPKVIEFNARFGDPETEVVLPRMKSDLIAHMLDVLNHKETTIEWYDEACLGVVLASKGYPGSYPKGAVIEGVDACDHLLFHSGTARKNDQWVTNGGRVLFVVGKGNTIVEAQKDAYKGVKQITSDNLFYRTDIGHKAIR